MLFYLIDLPYVNTMCMILSLPHTGQYDTHYSCGLYCIIGSTLAHCILNETVTEILGCLGYVYVPIV